MKLFHDFRLGHRIGGAVALLLLLLALGNILSARQNHQLDDQFAELVAVTLPAGRLVQELTSLVEEVRGMAALHLALGGGPEVAALEARLQARRQRLDLRLAGAEARIQDDGDRQHCQAVKASMAGFWIEQDKLLALSRRAAHDPAAAAAARALLAGAAQQTFQTLAADLDAWWAYHEQRAGQAAQHARAGTSQALLLQAMLAALSLLLAGVGIVLVRRLRGQSTAPVLRGPAAAVDAAIRAGDLARSACLAAERGSQVMHQVEATMAALQRDSHRIAELIADIDAIAFQTRLLALNAAVESARRGDAGAGLGLAADAVRGLAQRAGAAAQALQLLVVGTVDRIAASRQDVHSAGGSLAEVVVQVRQVSMLIDADERESSGA
jgi:hypothetical protein